MKSDRDTVVDTTASRSKVIITESAPAWVQAARVKDMFERLDGVGRRVVTRAPGRLDVLAGISDDFGASAVYMPASACVYVAMRNREDGRILITDITSPSSSGHEPTVIDSSALPQVAQSRSMPADQNGMFEHDAFGVSRGVVGTLVEALRTGLAQHLNGGVSVVVYAGGRALACLGRSTAVTAAVLRAFTGLIGAQIDDAAACALARRVASDWYGVPASVGEVSCGWLGRPGTLTRLGGGDDGQMALPKDVECLAIYCGAGRADASEKWVHARTAAGMGQAIIRRIVEVEGGAPDEWDGSLARIGVETFSRKFRHRVPSTIRGRDFTARFGAESNGVGSIDGGSTYKVRSRTEHHIYEQPRCEQFVNRIHQAAERDTDALLCEMGELMYQSHWSYGQRCGLGSVGADGLVRALRRCGPSSGIYGARVSGRGCGGVVTVMMADNDNARSALAEVTSAYTSKTGNEVSLIRGSTPGVNVDGFFAL